MDILSMLPVPSLLRFKCASKLWKILISEPNFKMKHFNHAKNSQNSQKFLIARPCPKHSSILYYSLPLVQPVEDVKVLCCPSNDRSCHHKILCCCDSLALLWVNNEHLLWNPTTKESIVLPNPRAEFHEACFKYGMGYDSTSDDYKILRIDDTTKITRAPCEILLLKSGSWREVDRYPRVNSNKLYGMDSLAFVRGAFHWIGVDVSFNYFVVVFSISNEAYGEIPLPKLMLEEECYNPDFLWLHIGISVLGGLLCAYKTDSNGEASISKLWVMKNYGIKETWTELFTIRDTHVYSIIPKYRFADGEVLLYYKKRQFYGFRTSNGSFELWPVSRAMMQGFVFIESLISPELLI